MNVRWFFLCLILFYQIKVFGISCSISSNGSCAQEGQSCTTLGQNGSCKTEIDLFSKNLAPNCVCQQKIETFSICPNPEGRSVDLILYKGDDWTVSAGIKNYSNDDDDDLQLGGAFSFTFQLGRKREVEKLASSFKHVLVLDKLIIRNLSATGIQALSGLAIIGLPTDISIEAARFRTSNSDITNATLRTSAEVIPDLASKVGSFPITLITSDNPASLPVPVGSSLSLDFALSLKMFIEEDKLSLFEFYIIPIFVNTNQEYELGNLWKLKLKAVSLNSSSNTLNLSNLLEGDVDCDKRVVIVLPVTLTNFQAQVERKNIAFTWETASETKNLGMNLWCAQMQGNQFEEITQLNSELIPSKAILPNYGASYSSTDYPYVNTNLQPGVQHCTLEDLDAGGQCTLHCDQIDTVVVGEGNKLSDMELNELQAGAIALCHEHKQNGVCLDQLLAPNQ